MRFDFSEERLEFFLHHLIERGLLGAMALVGEPCRQARQGRLQRGRHDARSPGSSA
jgi:hypothetical protein